MKLSTKHKVKPMRITWKIVADYGLLLAFLIVGGTIIWFLRTISIELKSLDQSLSKLVRHLADFLKKK
jgi:hypothetical protein